MDEAALLEAAQKLDKDALGKIFDLYSSAIYNYALRLSRDPIAADNIVGDVFALLLEQFSRGKGPNKNLRSYLYQTTYHVIVDQARNRRHVAPLEVSDMTFKGDNSPVAEQTEENALLDALKNAMESELTTDQRHVLVLRFVEGFSIQETAEIVKKTVSNVKVIQNRGTEKLRQALDRWQRK